jgi:hypothetical protein
MTDYDKGGYVAPVNDSPDDLIPAFLCAGHFWLTPEVIEHYGVEFLASIHGNPDVP